MFFLAATLVGWIGGDFVYRKVAAKNGNAETAGLDIAGLDNDGRMCGQLTELKLQNFIPWEDFHSVSLSETYALLVLRCY